MPRVSSINYSNELHVNDEFFILACGGTGGGGYISLYLEEHITRGQQLLIKIKDAFQNSCYIFTNFACFLFRRELKKYQNY